LGDPIRQDEINPFLGTCGGYQHALLEYAHDVIGLSDAAHAELHPHASLRLLDRMHCPLIEKPQKILVTKSEFRSLYGADSELEGFHCSFALNSKYEHLFAESTLEIVARSENGEARAFCLKGHPFFVGTQFQPERKSLIGSVHPLVSAFFVAALNKTKQTDPPPA
jgi:CTP synthase (UTP-ammonia lyase)